MAYCTSCGEELTAGAAFCANCGQKTGMTGPPLPPATVVPLSQKTYRVGSYLFPLPLGLMALGGAVSFVGVFLPWFGAAGESASLFRVAKEASGWLYLVPLCGLAATVLAFRALVAGFRNRILMLTAGACAGAGCVVFMWLLYGITSALGGLSFLGASLGIGFVLSFLGFAAVIVGAIWQQRLDLASKGFTA